MLSSASGCYKNYKNWILEISKDRIYRNYQDGGWGLTCAEEEYDVEPAELEEALL